MKQKKIYTSPGFEPTTPKSKPKIEAPLPTRPSVLHMNAESPKQYIKSEVRKRDIYQKKVPQN